MKRYQWIVQNKRTGEAVTYNSSYGPCNKACVNTSPDVIEWANGDPISIFPCEQ